MENISAAGLRKTELAAKILKFNIYIYIYIKPDVQEIKQQVTNR